MNNNSANASPTSTDELNANLKRSQLRSLSRRWHLPPGWEHYFSVSNRGMYIVCPMCPWKPGREVEPWQRWKVLANHMAVAHAREGNLRPGSGTGSPAPDKVTAMKSWWADKTPEERRREMARRRRKWTPEAKAKWMKKGGKRKTKTPKAKLAKQKIYQARSVAKKNGHPLPPLPKESEAA